MVHKGTVYLYTSHDEDDATGFLMRDWLCYTSTDMVNWTDHGSVASLHSFPWAAQAISGWGGFENGAWAPQCIARNGKFYLYCPVQGRGIGVLVADNPYGPFTDPIGKPLIGGQYDSIDPTVFIDYRRSGVSVLGESESLVREAKQGHDLFFGRDHQK